MTTFSEAVATAQDGGVYTLHLTRSEASTVMRALDNWDGHTADSVRVLHRLAARLELSSQAGRHWPMSADASPMRFPANPDS